MNAKNEIIELCESNIQRYKSNDFDLFRDLEIERHDIEGYHGREILELLQNVDDACAKTAVQSDAQDKVIATISYIDGVLNVSNTGTKFDFEGIKALTIGHISTKDENGIGSKGSGFRGVLNWSESIRIFSGDYKVGFSKEYTDQKYSENMTDENIKKQAEKHFKKQKTLLSFPMLSMPQYLDQSRDSQYDTVIEIEINQEKNTGDYCLENQLGSFDYRTLLFLPNLTQIDIITDNNKKSFIKDRITENGVDYVELKVSENEIESSSETFIIKKQTLNYLEGNKYLLIAVPLAELAEYPLYCYFPTREFSPFPVLMHAPFILTGDRNYVTTENTEYNKKLFRQLIDLLTDIANRISQMSIDSKKAVKIITPDNLTEKDNWNFAGVFSKFNLQQHFFEAIKQLKIFPTVNKIFVAIHDGVKRLIEKPPSVFKGEKFEFLLKYFDSRDVDTLVSLIAKKQGISIDYTDQELCQIVNSRQFEIPEQVEVFLWWHTSKERGSTLPNLLKDTSGNYIDFSETKRCFLPTETGINVLPSSLSFVKLTVLNKEYMAELINKIQTSDEQKWKAIKAEYSGATNGRILAVYSDRWFLVRFTEQSKNAVVRDINNQIETKEQAIAYYKWLFDLYHNEGGAEYQSFDRIDYLLPTPDGVFSADKLFFGDEWGNVLGEKIFSLINKESALWQKLIAPEMLGISVENIAEHKQFLSNLGVKMYPTIEEKHYEWQGHSAFRSFIKQKHSIDFNINFLSIHLINNFEFIVANLSMRDIISWIKCDESLRNHLMSIENGSYARQQRNRGARSFASNEYIVWVLNNTPWLEFDGKRYTPKQVVSYGKLKSQCERLIGIDEKELVGTVGEALYAKLDFNKSLGELNEDQIKTLLVELPDFQMYKREISRKLYEEIVLCKIGKEPRYDTAGIQILCKNGEFYDAKDVRYSYGKLPKSIESKAKLAWIGEKRNTNTIKKWLGVSRYETLLQYHDSRASLVDSREFRKEIDELKIVVLSTIEITRENVSKIKRLTIEPRSGIVAKDFGQDGNTVILDDYNYIESADKKPGENIYYMNLPLSVNTTQQMLKSAEFASEIAGIFKEALNLNINESLIELLVGRNTLNRKQKIAEEYDVDRWADAYEALYEKSLLNSKVLAFFKERHVSDKHLETIGKIDFAASLNHNELEYLLGVFRIFSIELGDFESMASGIRLDLPAYWCVEIKKYCKSNIDGYLSGLYKKLLPLDTEQHERFEEFKHGFINYSPEVAEAAIDFDVKEYVANQFGVIDDKSFDEKCFIDVDRLYSANYRILKDKTENESLLGEYIDSNRQIKSLVYFLHDKKEYGDMILSKYHEWRMKEKASSDDVVSSKEIEPEYAPTTQVLPNENVSADRRSGSGQGLPRTQTTYQHDKSNQSKARNGKNAEKIAYQLLKKMYPSLKWTSENAVEGLADRNTSKKYDMYYVSNGETIYVEIKALSSEFYMSIDEYEFAIKNGDNHVIYFVDLEKEKLLKPTHIKNFEAVKKPSEFVFSIKTDNDEIL